MKPLYMIDKEKCLHDFQTAFADAFEAEFPAEFSAAFASAFSTAFSEAISELQLVPTNHASTADTYGASTYTQYGHVMRTHESTTQQFSPLNDWNDIRDVQGKAVDGVDGYCMAQAIKGLLTSVNTLPLPTGAVLASDVYSTSAAFTEAMGYGTWELLTRQTITYDSTSVELFYFKRTA